MKGPVPEAAHVIVKAGGLTLSKFMTRSIRLDPAACRGQEGSNIFTNSEGRLLK